MTPERFYRVAVAPACAELARAGVTDSTMARRFLLAIALQESGLRHRRQVSADGSESGPASGFFQFEKAGACKGVLAHPAAAPLMRAVCDNYNVSPEPAALWEAIRYQDIVAVAVARLLVRTLPQPIPATADDAWMQYRDAWRPGKPRFETWAANWATAGDVLESAQ